jgi:SAM-dependent methyltransferase
VNADLTRIRKRAASFRKDLASLKARLRTEEFEWYPYDTLSVFDHLEKLLTGENRRLLELAGNLPMLDVGSGDGDLAFFLESLGFAVHVVDSPQANHNAMRGLFRLREALGSSVEVHTADLDNSPLPPGPFGLVFLLGVLYHLRNPLHVLDALARHAHHLVLSTRVARVTPGAGTPIWDEPVAYLAAPREFNRDDSNYWIFSWAGLARALDLSGWEMRESMAVKGPTTPLDPIPDERAYCLLRSRLSEGAQIELLEGWHELEYSTFRWTHRRFSVLVRSAGAGARRLTLRFYIPEDAIRLTGPITLTAEVDGVRLPAQTFREPGEAVYSQETSGLRDPARVVFEVDQTAPQTAMDVRERGVVVQFYKREGDRVESDTPLTLG